MNALVRNKLAEIKKLSRRYHVKKLELFGSAAIAGKFKPKSDFDFLVEFQADTLNRADCYFGLWEELQHLFGRRVDLVETEAIRNPYFLESIARSRALLYAA
jgi:predicted nucleotidyltransferase